MLEIMDGVRAIRGEVFRRTNVLPFIKLRIGYGLVRDEIKNNFHAS